MSVKTYEDKIFALQTKETSYIIRVNDEGLIENLYWGDKIEEISDFSDEGEKHKFASITGPQGVQEECSSYGEMRYKETSLKICYADGVDDFRYYLNYSIIEDNTLELCLKDKYYDFFVHLYYQVFEDSDVIKKWRVLENKGVLPVTIERIYSAEFGLEGSNYKAINFTGRWGAEFQKREDSISYGKKVYESLYGISGHAVNPAFIVHKDAEETSGNVYYGVLEYSGNFKTVLEAVNCGYLNILIGISDTNFSWQLKKEECFTTPAVYAGYTKRGFEEMSNTLAAFSRKYIMPERKADEELPVLYNSWYATLFDVKCEEQMKLAKKAARAGIELFVIDDGWFQGRVNDQSGLGDWFVDTEKFPNGMKPLIDLVHKLGMKFGIWIEPEMVNPKSKLYSNHPEWIYQYRTREVLMGRNQYMLDMANQQIIDYLYDTFHELLSQNKIDYIKWDMNRYVSELGCNSIPKSEWKSLAYRNTQGIYQLVDRLRNSHPNVEFEACASGGGRVDYGAMHYFDEYWPSDNTDPLDRLEIQESYSFLYPIKYMRAWVTDDFGMNQRKIPLKFAMYSAMCGSLGIGINLNEIKDEKISEIEKYVEEYKVIRPTVQMGKLHRLQSMKEGNIQAVSYTDSDKCVLFVFLNHERYGITEYRVHLRGLEEDAIYSYYQNEKESRKSGSYLMLQGIKVSLHGDYDSTLICFAKIKNSVKS